MSTEPTYGGLPFAALDRPKPKRRPIEAMRRFRLLVADKDDTEQVFHIIGALSGGHLRGRLAKALRTEEGRAAAREHRDLQPYLDDHEALARLPDGSLGRAYLSFMNRERLTAAGLKAEQRKFKPEVHADLVQWYADRSRDMHDVIHVLTGYKRGVLGELCNLAFTYGLNRGGLGDVFIAVMGTVEMKRWYPKLPLYRVLIEAVRAGRRAKDFYLVDIPALFAMPLEDAKAALGIGALPTYERASIAITSAQEPVSSGAPYEVVASG